MIEKPHDHHHAGTGKDTDPPASIRAIHATEDEIAMALRTLMGRLPALLAAGLMEAVEEQRG